MVLDPLSFNEQLDPSASAFQKKNPFKKSLNTNLIFLKSSERRELESIPNINAPARTGKSFRSSLMRHQHRQNHHVSDLPSPTIESRIKHFI